MTNPNPSRTASCLSPVVIGDSPALARALEVLTRAAPTDVPVLILGETGTGKELAARRVHAGSSRCAGPFVAINCAALPEALVESELFGHEAGAFTGAIRRRIGRFEQAHGGTLFLDEIGDLPLAAQAKVLRALQERVIERVGGGEPIAVDVRVVAATHRDLVADLAARMFRRDLFYRLSVVTARLPALRDRLGDLDLLIDHFLGAAQRRLGRRGIALSSSARRRLRDHAWPGNIRELENVVTCAVALADDGAVIGPAELTLDDDAALPGSPLPSPDLRDILDFCEREILRRMLEHHGGNRTHTAAALRISRQALQQKLARWRDRDAAGALVEAG
jgi:transcriptional regulator with PAS, ATPase and Fis domain